MAVLLMKRHAAKHQLFIFSVTVLNVRASCLVPLVICPYEVMGALRRNSLDEGKIQKKGRPKSSKKRSASSSSLSKKKHKYTDVAAQDLPWRRLPHTGYDFEADGGVLELEEVDEVDVVWEETADGGKSVRFKVCACCLDRRKARRADGLAMKMREDKLAATAEDIRQHGLDQEPDLGAAEEAEWTGFSTEGGDDPEHGEQTDEVSSDASTSKIIPPPHEDSYSDFDSVPFDGKSFETFWTSEMTERSLICRLVAAQLCAFETPAKSKARYRLSKIQQTFGYPRTDSIRCTVLEHWPCRAT